MSKERTRILIVGEEETVRDTAAAWLAADRVDVATAPDEPAALAMLHRERWSILLVDMQVSGGAGLEFLERARRLQPDAVAVIMTAYAAVDAAVCAIKLGAYDYIVKPFDPEELSLMIDRIVMQQRLVRENAILRKALEREYRLRDFVRSQANRSDGSDGASAHAGHDLCSLDEVERTHVAFVLESTHGNVTQAARILGIDRVTLYNKIRKYHLRESAHSA